MQITQTLEFWEIQDFQNLTTNFENTKLFLFHYSKPWISKHIDFLREIKQTYPKIRILITSCKMNAIAVLNAFRVARVWDFVLLPDEFPFLQKTIEKLTIEPLANESRNIVFPITCPDDVIHFRQQTSISDKATYFISQHYANKIYIRDVARYCDVSPEVLARIFKRECNCNYREFLKRYRLNIAKRLLSETNLLVEHVAFESGYEDVSLFTRLFKQMYGVSPSKYRALQQA